MKGNHFLQMGNLNGVDQMNKFNFEIERFIKQYYQKHDEEKAKSEKIITQTDADLGKLAKQSKSFEKDLESRIEKVDKWLANKQKQLEDYFE